MAANPLEGWKIQEVVARVLSDPQFAEQVKSDGLAAIRAGSGSQEWQTYFSHFAASPAALTTLNGSEESVGANCTCNSNTGITFTTLSTLVTPVPTCCGLTTTTTTTTTSGS
jgi:hypothetical protein